MAKALVLITLVTTAVAQPAGQGDMPEILRKVIDASDNIRYSGVRRVELKMGPDRVRHIEYIQKDRRRTRIEFPEDGSFRGQIIVETEKERRHFFPDKNQIEVLPPRREVMIGQLAKLFKKRGKNVLIQVSEGPSVAGQATKMVQVSFGNGHVFQKIWVDPQTYLVLKREVYNREGQVQASSEFTRVDYRPRFRRDAFSLNMKGAKIVTPRNELEELVSRGGFQNVSLSPKDPYKLESCHIQRIAEQPTLVQMYVNANGRITLFQFRGSVDGNRLRQFGRGDINAHSWQSGGSTFVLLGDASADALRQIAQRIGS